MAELRQTCPVAETSSGWFLSTYAGAVSALQQVDVFVGSFMDTSKLDEDEVMISAIPEPRHGRIRRVVNGAMAPHKTSLVEPFVRELAATLLDETLAEAKSGDEVDLMSSYVDPIPSTVIARILGVPVTDFDRFRRWSDELLEAQNDGGPRTLSETHPEFAAYIQDQIAHRRRAGADAPDDIITRLIQTDVDGELLSDAAIRTQTMFLIVAGNETTRNLIGNAFHSLATEPALYTQVRADRSLIPTVVEESLRHDSPVQVLGRAALAPTVIEGCPIDVGERIVIGVASANRDERVFDRPDDFRVDRPKPRDHVAFGAGPHVCPGAFLARLEAVVALETFCDRVESVALPPGHRLDVNPVFWALGPRSLRVRLTAD